MGIFDKLKERVADAVADRAKQHSADIAKAAAKKTAESALAAAKGAGRKIEEAIFGERDEVEKPEDEGTPAAKKKREEDMGEVLRAADKRVKEGDERRATAAKLEAAERAAKALKAEREVDDELAAIKKKLGKK